MQSREIPLVGIALVVAENGFLVTEENEENKAKKAVHII